MLVIKKHRKLLLNLKDPDRVLTVMPTAKQVTVKGKSLVVVPHRADEVKVLRNLGFDPPPPMSSYYDWPGRFAPFAHQRITAEFLTSNPRSFCLNGMGCISGDAKVRVSRKGKSMEIRLDALYEKFNTLPDKDSWKVRSLMGDRFGMNKLLDVLNKGTKRTLRIELEDGKVFNATPDHSIARPDGSWTNAGDLNVGDTLVTNGTVTVTCPQCGTPRELDKYYAASRGATKTCRKCKHVAHSQAMCGKKNPSWKGGVVVVLPKQSRITSITDGGEHVVFDLCMEAPHNNFVVNGVVVHNSGKTLSVLWAYDYLKKEGLVNKMLVISPLSTLERTWGDEIFCNFPELTFTVLHGSRDKRHKLIDNDFDIYLINHDGIKSKDTLAKLVAKEGIDVVCVDEIASFRNASTDRWKALSALTKDKDWVWGLTGTPTPNAPTDAWAQVRLISPGRVPKYYTHFRDKVMYPATKFKWTPREGAIEAVQQCMQPAIRFAREDCIDLPPTTFVTRQSELSAEQSAAYRQMLTRMKTEIAGEQVSAINEAAKLTKLLQIVCGTAYSDNGEVTLPSPHRMSVIKEIIEEAEGKVIVFVPFTGALKGVADELAEDFTVEVVHGSVSKTERDRIFGSFQKHENPRVLVANAAAMSHGITLTAANTTIWYAPINSLEVYEQANARTVRPGQKRNTLIVNVEATDLERKMYARLQHKGKMQGLLLDLLKGKSDE